MLRKSASSRVIVGLNKVKRKGVDFGQLLFSLYLC
nr:MAG TPA: hypothetical protein [Caudoviricetes sp.]